MKPKDADDIKDIARKVLVGKRLQYETGQWKPNIIKLWRAEIEKQSS